MSDAKTGRGIRHVAASPEVVVLVCRKCSRKLHGGFGRDGGERLAKALARAFRAASGGGKVKPHRSRAPIIEVDCLDLCPKGAVVALRADRPGDWLVVPRGTPVRDVGVSLGILSTAPEEA